MTPCLSLEWVLPRLPPCCLCFTMAMCAVLGGGGGAFQQWLSNACNVFRNLSQNLLYTAFNNKNNPNIFPKLKTLIKGILKVWVLKPLRRSTLCHFFPSTLGEHHSYLLGGSAPLPWHACHFPYTSPTPGSLRKPLRKLLLACSIFRPLAKVFIHL